MLFLNPLSLWHGHFSAVPLTFYGGDFMYFDFVFDIFSNLPSLSILVPVVAVSALYGIVFLCISLYRSVEK